jgi:hypothetical protein
VVERFEDVGRGRRCESSTHPAPLLGTYWRLIQLPGDGEFAIDSLLRVHIMLDGDQGRVSGSGGCRAALLGAGTH